jgi:hypothetical protein
MTTSLKIKRAGFFPPAQDSRLFFVNIGFGYVHEA